MGAVCKYLTRPFGGLSGGEMLDYFIGIAEN
jgi:hypothetical protein